MSDLDRPVVLIPAGYYLPGFLAGGPIRSLVNMVGALARDFDFHLVAFDRDLGSNERFPGIGDDWMRVGEASVRYIAADGAVVRSLWALLHHERYDLLYLQTFFDPRFGMLPLLMRRVGLTRRTPVVIAVRGQFSPGAVAIRRVRKAVYTALVRRLLKGDEIWHATAEIERDHIQRHFGPVRVVVAANVPSLPQPVRTRPEKKVGHLRVVFLSRVARKKNLDAALRALAGLSGHIEFDIYGPIEDASYWAECVALAESLGHTGTRVVHRGAIAPEMVGETIANYHLFFFPTRGENFGHVILEALLAGTPCLLSDQTPWHGLEAAGAGWDLPLSDPARFTEAVRWCVNADAEAMASLARGAHDFGLAYLAGDQSVRSTRAMLTAALQSAS
jgi:glycosyltransferase involved in cell wall biosynthesis